MSSLRFSPAAFLVAFCGTYAVCLALDVPLFRYYPLHGEFTWGAAGRAGAGPAMAWYGLMADAAIAGAIVAVLVPDPIAERTLRGRVWLFPCATMLVCAYLLRHLFG